MGLPRKTSKGSFKEDMGPFKGHRRAILGIILIAGVTHVRPVRETLVVISPARSSS